MIRSWDLINCKMCLMSYFFEDLCAFYQNYGTFWKFLCALFCARFGKIGVLSNSKLLGPLISVTICYSNIQHYYRLFSISIWNHGQVQNWRHIFYVNIWSFFDHGRHTSARKFNDIQTKYHTGNGNWFDKQTGYASYPNRHHH